MIIGRTRCPECGERVSVSISSSGRVRVAVCFECAIDWVVDLAEAGDVDVLPQGGETIPPGE